MYFTTYNRDMGEITMEPAYHGIEEETVTRLLYFVKSVFRV